MPRLDLIFVFYIPIKPITKLLAPFQYGNTFQDYNNKFELEWKMYA